MTAVARLLALAAALAVPQDARIRELVERLRSDRIEERNQALRLLKESGRDAFPELERLAASDDLDAASLARHLLKTLPIREKFSPRLRSLHPNLDERLARGPDRVWAEVFLELAEARGAGPRSRTVQARDLDVLVVPALLHGSDRQRQAIFEVVVQWNLRSAIPPMLAFAKDSNLSMPAIKSLSRLDVRDVIPLAVARLKEPDEPSRSEAGFALTNLHAGEAWKEVAELGDHRGTWALGYLGRMEAVPTLIRALKHPNGAIRWPAVQSLWILHARDAVDAIVPLLEDPDPDVRGHAATAIGRLGHPDALELLRIRLKDAHREVRDRAATSLGERKILEAAPDLAALLQDGEPEVRRAGALALARLGDPRNVTLLEPLLKVGDSSVQITALRAVADLRPESCGPLLRPLLKDPTAWVRAAAITAIAATDPKSAPLLREFVSDPVAVAQIAACGALAALNDRESVPAIREKLRSSDKNLRVAAAKALCSLGSRDGVEILLEEAGSMSALSGLRHPEAWRKLSTYRLPSCAFGNLGDQSQQMLKETGFAVDPPELLRSLLPSGRWWPTLDPEPFLEHVLRYFGDRFDLIVEPGLVRVVTIDDAYDHWSEWAKQR